MHGAVNLQQHYHRTHAGIILSSDLIQFVRYLAFYNSESE